MTQPSPCLPAYILAGGQSSRFGRDKARTEIDGEALVWRVARSLAPVATTVTVVAQHPDSYADLGLRTIADRQRKRGPLAGIDAALADDASQGWILCAACDLVGLRATWLTRLCEARRPHLAAIAFRGARWQSLPALFHHRVSPKLHAALASDTRAVWKLIEQVPHAAVPLPTDWEDVVDVNTPDALRRALLLAGTDRGQV